jgi:hypothetical protein
VPRATGRAVPWQVTTPIRLPPADTVRMPVVDPDASEPGWAWWAGTQEIPLPWELRNAVRQRRPGGLRLPAPDDPAPDTGRMLGVCCWAALLGIIGVAVAGRAMIAMLAGRAPHWYEHTMLGCGLVGIVLTATAFLAVHRPSLPWLLLTSATVPLLVSIASTMIAL